MSFELLYVIFIVVTVLNYVFLDIKVDKIKMESLDKDKVIDSLMAHNKALCKLNSGFKDHERRIENIEEHLSYIEGRLLLKKSEEPKKPEYTCEDCKFYNPYNGIGFANAVNYFKCEKLGCSYPIEYIKCCSGFEKEENLDEDENIVYANNVKIDISSKGPTFYKADRILTYEECLDRISRLFLDGAIGAATMNELLERLKQ